MPSLHSNVHIIDPTDCIQSGARSYWIGAPAPSRCIPRSSPRLFRALRAPSRKNHKTGDCTPPLPRPRLGWAALRWGQALLDESRKQRAWWCLLHTPHPVEEIAAHLGDQDTRDFSRSFRRWHGSMPRTMRRLHGSWGGVSGTSAALHAPVGTCFANCIRKRCLDPLLVGLAMPTLAAGRRSLLQAEARMAGHAALVHLRQGADGGRGAGVGRRGLLPGQAPRAQPGGAGVVTGRPWPDASSQSNA